MTAVDGSPRSVSDGDVVAYGVAPLVEGDVETAGCVLGRARGGVLAGLPRVYLPSAAGGLAGQCLEIGVAGDRGRRRCGNCRKQEKCV